jgi:acetoin utilization protein AcuB
MLVRHFMTRNVITLEETLHCREALNELHENNIRRAPVTKKGELVGMVSERDLLRVLPGTIGQVDTRAGEAAERLPIARVMTTKLITLDPEAHLEDAGRKMSMHKIGGLPVVTEGKLVGILTESDVFRAFTRMFETRGVLRISFARVGSESAPPDLIKLVLKCGGHIRGLIVHDRPGGEELTVLRVQGGDRDRLLAALVQASYHILEYVDDRDSPSASSAA